MNRKPMLKHMLEAATVLANSQATQQQVDDAVLALDAWIDTYWLTRWETGAGEFGYEIRPVSTVIDAY